MAATFYCITDTELNSLMSVRNDCDWRVYMSLRKRADFNSGRLEHQTSLEITTGKIAREISLPATNGLEAVVFERWDVLRSIERLIKTGLVDQFEKVGRYLRLRLPLSIKASERSARNDTENTQRSARRNAPFESAETLAAQGSDNDVGQGCAPRSAHNSPENDQRCARNKNGEPSQTVAAQGFQADGEGSFSKGKPISVNPPQERRGDISPSAIQTRLAAYGGSAIGNEEKPEDRYRAVVFEEGNDIIRYINSDMSNRIYRSWVSIKADIRDVRDAVRKVIADASKTPTPNSIDTALRMSMVPPKAKVGKGSLVL